MPAHRSYMPLSTLRVSDLHHSLQHEIKGKCAVHFEKNEHRMHRRQIKLKRARLIRRLTPLSHAAARCVCDAWCQPNWRSGVDAVQRRSCLNLVHVAPVGLLMYYSPCRFNHLFLFSIQTPAVPDTLSTLVSVFCLFVPIVMYVHCVLQAFSDTIFSLGINKDPSYLISSSLFAEMSSATPLAQ